MGCKGISPTGGRTRCMNWIQNLLRGDRDEGDSAGNLEDLRRRFDSFRELVEKNNEVLGLIGDMEEKAQGEFLFDIAYVRGCVDRVESSVRTVIDLIIEIGGPQYETLRARYAAILGQINNLLPGSDFHHGGPLILDFERINRIHSSSVGGKNAQLGEMHALGLRVPDGFAITAAGFRLFLKENKLNELIQDTLKQLDIKCQQDLVNASGLLRAMILAAPIPSELAESIKTSYEELTKRTGEELIALRSSAVGEDTLYSFAGQYSSFLNVSKDQLLLKYREILSSKYSPRAIYYFLSHSLEEAGLSMSVGCTRMVDAASSGVIYTRDPLDPESECVHVHSIYGLGPYLVGGTLTPDVYTIHRDGFKVESRTIRDKPVQLRPAAKGGTEEHPVEEGRRSEPCLNDEQLAELGELAVKLEEHYDHPQDIEFAYDQDGKLYLLQSRPLRTICTQPAFELPDMSGHIKIACGGTTVCPGAGLGRVVHVSSRESLEAVEQGDVVVAANPMPSIGLVLDKVSAVVTEVGSSASHLAALVRERRIPTIVGVAQARSRLPQGETVTVDATGTCIYSGEHQKLVQARLPEYDLFQDTAIFDLLRRLLKLISPLNMVNPGDAEFRAERCLTLHDIIRYSHQRGIEEIFSHARSLGKRKEFGAQLKSVLPLPVHVLNLDEPEIPGRKQVYDDNSLPSEPMQMFWNGMLQEKWPFAHPDPTRLQVARDKDAGLPVEEQFTEHSFAVIRKEYMLASLRLGYHFTSVEAELCDDSNRNFIRVHYKGGGAADERRRRRISLLEELLDRMGFEHTVKSDFIDCRAQFLPREQAELNLQRVGRLVMLTKQLDMALSNERITRWYIEDFARKLDLEHKQAFPL